MTDTDPQKTAPNRGGWYFEQWEQLRAIRDGNCYMIVRQDFVDLQNSPAVFYEYGTWQYDIIHQWHNATPLAHVPLSELASILERLYGLMRTETSLKELTKTRP
jgi:hypothetical protein